MACLIFDFTLIIIVIHLQLMSVNSDDDMRKNPIKMDVNICANFYASEACHNVCDKDWSLQSVIHSNTCENDLTILDACTSSKSFRWDEDDEDLSCTSLSTSTGSSVCTRCICTQSCLYSYTPSRPYGFKPLRRTSNTQNNEIITSVGLKRFAQSVVFDIETTKQPARGTVYLDRLTKFYRNFAEPSTSINEYDLSSDEFYLDEENRNLRLDEIFVPFDYVVTGVAFHAFEEADESSVAQMIVQGTRYDSSTLQLIDGSSKWFDSDHQAEPRDVAYENPRSKIPLKNCGFPEDATDIEEYPGTNYYVRFRPTDEEKSDKMAIIPYLSPKKADAGGVPLRGIGLAYAHQTGFGGYIFVKVFRHEAWNIMATAKPPPTTSTTTLKPMPMEPSIILRNFTRNGGNNKGIDPGSPESEDEYENDVQISIELQQSSSSTCHCHYIVNVILIVLIVLQ